MSDPKHTLESLYQMYQQRKQSSDSPSIRFDAFIVDVLNDVEARLEAIQEHFEMDVIPNDLDEFLLTERKKRP